MKNLFIILFSLLSFAAFAQKKDSTQLKRTVFEAPTEINGFKVRYATLSKGKYQEIFSNDTIQQIGSVLFNRVTSEVVGEVIKDSLYFPADVVSRWWSIDPHWRGNTLNLALMCLWQIIRLFILTLMGGI